MKTQKKSRKLQTITIIVVLVLAAAAGTYLYKQHEKNEAIAKERAQYAQAEKDLDALSAQIIAKFGQPDDQKKVKKCGYTSSVLGTGTLFCTVNYFLFYPVAGNDQGREIVKEAASISSVLPKLNNGDSALNIASSSFRFARLNCSSGFSIHPSTDNLTNQGYADLHLLNDTTGLLIELGCSAQHPRAAYYPIRDY